MAVEHKQIPGIVKPQFPRWVDPQARSWNPKCSAMGVYRRSNVNCPSCRSDKEMLFMVLSLSFICQEPHCGQEFQVSPQEAEVLLEPEERFVLA